MQKLLLFLCLLLMSKNFYSQNLSNAHLLITYQNPTNLKACTNNDALNLSIKNTSTQSIAANSIVKIKLPVGISVVSLVPGSYTSNLIPSSDNTYTFQNSAIHASNATLALNVQLKADCGIYSLLNASNGSSLSVQNEIKMDYSIAGTSYNFDQFTLSYNIAQANVKTIVTASNQTMTINDDYTPFIQEVKYYVVGNSSVNQFGIKFVVPTGLTFQQIDHISINGVNVTGYGTPTLVGSTYTLLLNASTFGMSTFNSGDVVNVYYKYKPSCLSSVQIDYSAYIMCFGNPCDFDHSFGFVNLIQSPPIVNTSFTNDNNADFCGNVTHATYVVSNAGSVYTIYNPKIKIESAYTTIQNVKVNGALVTGGLPTNLSGIFFIDLKALLTSNGHALSDLNGDGVFGEIAPLQNVTITYDIALTSMGDNCTAGIININEFKTFLQYYNSNCASTLSYTTTSNILVINNYNVSAPTLELTSGALGSGQSQTFKFCVDRKITETNSGGTITPLFIDNPILFGVDFQMPCGMSLVSASWENASSLSSTVTTSSTVNSGGTLVTFHSTNGQIPWINNELKGCFVANTTFSCTDCSSTQDFTVVSATGYGLFGNCQLKNIWACAGTSTCSSCYTPVACTTKGRINHSLFTVKRKTYGWTDNSMATPVTEAMVTANPTNYNLDGAYACDIVNIKLNGQVCGGASNFTPYITFSTYSSILTSALDFVDATLSINGVTNSISVVSIVNNAGLWTIQFTTKNGPFVDGTNLILNANFSVSKTTVSGASFPNELISGFKGAFFTNTGYVNGVAPISPDNLNFQDQNNLGCLYPTQSFRLYKVIEKITNSFNPQVKCGSSGKSEIFNLGYIGGIVGDEFPNEFRPFNQIQFPLTFTLSDATNYTVTGASFDLVGDGNTVGTNTNLNFTQTGNTITITPIGTFPIVDKMYQTSYFRFYMNIQMNCSVNQSTQNPNISQNHLLYKNYAYSNIACVENKDISYTENFSIYKPNLAFSFLNPIQSTTTNSVNYDVNISNIGGANSTDANYPWMLITYDPALVSIDVPGATVVNWNANQKFVKFNPLSTGYTISKYVQVIPLNCNVEQTTNITVQSGFDCKAFPLSSSTINGLDFCSLSTDVLQLKILKSNLNVDLFTSFSPSNLVNQCNGTFSVILQMYNDQKANITNLNLQGNPIPGLTLQNASYFYNIPTGQTFDPASFNWSQVNLANYTTISSLTSQTLQNGFSFANIGLNNLSTLNGFLANTGTTLSNFYQVKLTYTVDCNFNESSLLPFIVSALSNCNQNININSSTLINVSPLNHGLTLNITIDQSGCNGPISTNDISVQVTNPGTSTANNVYVSLFCDSDGNGLLTASDTYLSTNMISGGNLSAGQSATIGFNSTALPICGTMK
ncbi:MAG: hypothetical protein HYR91_02335, partial [Flavobacteriia bacterium]|nr:hypothetical protein [Flavobacteriia bacterium]